MTLGVADLEYKCSFDQQTAAKAKKELGETPETRLLEVKNLRSRLEKVPGLKPRTDIEFLLRFLRVRKYDQEKAFESVKKFYEIRKKHPEIFEDLKPSRIKHMLDNNYIEILKNRDKDGCKVFILRAGNWDDDRYTVLEPLKTFAICFLSLQHEEDNQVHGVHIIINSKDTTWSQAMKWTPSMCKVGFDILQSMVPLRLKRMDYVHQPSFFNQIFTMVKGFMKDKLAKRICLNSDKFEGLHTTIDPEYLPTDVGGKLEPYSYTEWKEELLKSDKYFEEDNKFGYVSMGLENDKKETSKEDASLQGLGGTFKKLDI